MDLLIDIGNTRIKWATLDEHGLGSQCAAAHATWTPQHVIDAIQQHDARPATVLVSNVSGVRMSSLVRDAVHQRWGIPATFVESTAHACGVRNAYSDPAKLGVDRWLGVIGAHHMGAAASCIVSVGTAMTIDGVTAAGIHLGGVIVPGPDLMISSLMRNTSEIMQRAAEGSVRGQLFADNTLGAVHQGVPNALAALVDRAVDSIQRSLGVTPQVLLTGGAADVIEKLVSSPCIFVPDLVLRGLAVLASSMRSERSKP